MRTSFAVGLAALAILAACEEKKTPPAPAPGPAASGESPSGAAASSKPSGGIPKFDPDQTRLFQPIPEGVDRPTLDDATKLGQMLFWDPRLSGNGKVACITCHDFSKAGADGLARPAVAGSAAADSGAERARNTPTVFNCGGSFAQGWDGRASTPEEFATLHTLDPSIMGILDEKKLVAVLSGIPAYAAAFKKAFPDDSPSISGETYGKAVGGFTKKLFARARWDKFLGGDKDAVTTEELSGFAMFVEAGCTSCHQGKYIGATQLQKLGMAKPWPPPAGTDPGRFAFSKQEMDRGMWKVPSLRNVTRTGPYLHDGSIATLAEVSKLMARHQVGKEINDDQAGAIAKFLGTLEGDPPKELTAKPSPAGGK